MSNTPEATTLASLRARTDRELIAIIGGVIERGFDLLRSQANGGTIDQHRAEADRAHAKAVKLLPLVYGLGECERRRLEARLAELRSALDGATYGRRTQSLGA